MTHYGLNPSFCNWNSTLPLFADAIRRGRGFEVFVDGKPTGEASTLDPVSKLPLYDGREHGVRIFSNETTAPAALREDGSLRLRTSSGGMVTISGKNWLSDILVGDGIVATDNQFGPWHTPSLQALASLRPKVLRTLDWQRTNERTDWSQTRVLPSDLFQGTDRGMAIELQCDAANKLKCHLWWCAPPRYELALDEYEHLLTEMLTTIRETAKLPPILEYGNELWNAGFKINGWLKQAASMTDFGDTWHDVAAREIALLKRVADKVFGEPGLFGGRPYYLFVGGQLTVPSHMDKILGELARFGVTPDIAGPALYVTPLKAQKGEWEATGAVPTQEELRDSMNKRLDEIVQGLDDGNRPYGPLAAHMATAEAHLVPYFACYEAGQSLIAGHHPWRAAALEAQRSEWMGDLYRRIRKEAESGGVDLLNWYSAATHQAPKDVRVDVFGLLEGDLSVPMLPKAKAAKGDL